jgi:hypothetical protein
MCEGDTSAAGTMVTVHRTQIAIFQDIFRTTNNIALALQAFLTIIYSMTSESSLLEANVQGPASITSFAVVSMPTQWTGFQVVVILASIHYIVFGSIMVAFLLRSNACLGNVWQMIAQMRGEGISDFVRDATSATDKEMKHRLKERGIGKAIVGVEEDESGVIRLKRKGLRIQE